MHFNIGSIEKMLNGDKKKVYKELFKSTLFDLMYYKMRIGVSELLRN